MAQDSKRERHLRRVKRENTLMFRQLHAQQYRVNVLIQSVMRMQVEEKYRAELADSPEEAL